MSDETKSEPTTEFEKLGGLLRLRREAAGLSRAKLAKRCRLSEATIKLIEGGRHRPSRSTILRICQVEALHLKLEDCLDLRRLPDGAMAVVAAPPQEPIAAPRLRNAFLAPAVDVLGVVEHQRLAFGARRGSLPAFLAYFDGAGAEQYRRWTQSCGGRWETMEAISGLLPVLSAFIDPDRTAGRGLDLIALGCGLGETETMLASRLLQEVLCGRFMLCLQDLSLPLLSTALRRAAELLDHFPQADAWALQADLEQLGPHRALVHRASSRRLITLLGGTIAEVDSEQRLIGESLASLAEPGDLLLVDAERLTPEPYEMTEAAHLRYCAWQLGQVRRARPDLASCRVDLECKHGTGWAEQEIEVIATAGEGATLARWTVGRRRRYAPDRLEAMLAGAGWSVIRRVEYGQRPPSVLLLCVRDPLQAKTPARAEIRSKQAPAAADQSATG